MPQISNISGPLAPATAADGGGPQAWTNPNNSKVEDGVVASNFGGPGGGGASPNQLNVTNFGFNIPALAVIDGIKMEAKVDSDGGSNDSGRIYLLINGGSSPAASAPNVPQNWFHGGVLTWNVYGGPTSLWGRTWTPAEINHANFGASLSMMRNTGTGNFTLDAVRITVYWHYALPTTPQDVPTRYVHRVYNDSNYLGILPKVTSPFDVGLDINSVGATLNIEVGLTADRASLPGDRLVTEAGDPLTDEDGNYLYTDGQPPIVGLGTSDPQLIQNGNRIEVWQYDYYNPNGKIVFNGQVRRIGASYGNSADNKIKILVVSTGADLDDYIARGGPFSYTTDVSQTSQNNRVSVSSASKGAGWNRYGQSWIVGAGASKLGAINLMLDGVADVTIDIYDSPNGNYLASITRSISNWGPAIFQFALPSLLTQTVGNTYFFTVSVAEGQSIWLHYDSTAPYAGGTMYNSSYAGGSGGGGYYTMTGDLYFVTGWGTPTTSATYTSVDPTSSMLKAIIDDYRLRGGKIKYDTSSIDATGLSLTVQFNTETILDAVKKVLSVSPSGFYYYVDLGTDTLYFKQTPTTATHKLIKGRHLNKIDLQMSIENVKNDLLFSGAETAGVNLYKEYVDQLSKNLYGQRLERKSDNRVSVTVTADAIGNSFIAENKDEYYETSVVIAASTMDLTLLKPGQTVSIKGFGGIIDTLLLQITRVQLTPVSATLTLGNLPKKFSNDFESIIRGLVAQQTVSNPTAPS